VTLRFLGEVADNDVAGLVDALDAALLTATEAAIGPAVMRLGRQVLCVPVDGVDHLARAVVDATADIGTPPEDRPFTGHVTLARARGRGVVPKSLVGTAVAMRWRVGDVRLVRSHQGKGGARYEDIHVRSLEP
jgi:2'-5' RNA ligase